MYGSNYKKNPKQLKAIVFKERVCEKGEIFFLLLVL